LRIVIHAASAINIEKVLLENDGFDWDRYTVVSQVWLGIMRGLRCIPCTPDTDRDEIRED
jgi:hypothetical protein